MLTRSIDLDPFDLTIEEKIFHGAKRVCVIFAMSALTLSGLDLMNIRIVENAAAFIHDSRNLADLPARIRSEIGRISIASASPSVTVMIPRGNFAARPPTAPVVPVSLTTRSESSRVAALAAVSHLDAVEVAMESPPDFTMKSLPRVAPEAAPVAAQQLTEPQAQAQSLTEPQAQPQPLVEPVKFAGIGPGALPTAAIEPPPLPMSLPMSPPIPLDMVPIPRPAPGVPPPSPAQRLHLEGKDFAKAERCLANAVYFESRSEPLRGQMAVAQVVMNRVFSGFYPNDVCAVVYQNAGRHLACQFTFACDGKRKNINERGAWARANRIARETLNGQIYVPEVAKSTHYHAVYVHPNWVHEMKKMVRYGIHNFYRPYAWGNGADEPVWGSAALAQNKKK